MASARWSRRRRQTDNSTSVGRGVQGTAKISNDLTLGDSDKNVHWNIIDTEREHHDARAAMVQCIICFDTIGAELGADLACGHGVCTDCAVAYLSSRVRSGEVSAEYLCCPLPVCRLEISPEVISRLLRGSEDGRKTHAMLLDLQAQRFLPEYGEALVGCPSPGCGKILVPCSSVEQREEVQCPTCLNLFCTACGQPGHRPQDCDEAELARMDPALRKLLESTTWTRCPVCRSMCERESGCNFMTCPSERCQGKTYFCYLCGELLTAADHAAHFEGFEGAIGRQGAFGSVCRNKRDAVNLALPARPPPPILSVVSGEDPGSLALRVRWGEHVSEPPTIYYRLRLQPLGAEARQARTFVRQVGDAFVDLKGLPRFQRYNCVVMAVNVNGRSEASDVSETVYLHPRELSDEKGGARPEAIEKKSRRWRER